MLAVIIDSVNKFVPQVLPLCGGVAASGVPFNVPLPSAVLYEADLGTERLQDEPYSAQGR
jgi:hypothetical protein